MEQGLAAQMVYGTGEGQTITHYYEKTEKPKNVNKKKKKPRKKKT